MLSTKIRSGWMFTLLISVVASPLASAADLNFRQLGADRGLEGSVVTSVITDRNGFLWVACREGLFRYDGYQAVRFMPEADRTDSLSDSDLRRLYEGADGSIWIATNTGGLNRLDPATGRFETWRSDPADSTTLSYDSVYDIAEAADGYLWLGTQSGLNRMLPGSGRFERFHHDPNDPDSLAKDYVVPVIVDSQGRTWVGTVGGGVDLFRPGDRGFDHHDLAALTGGAAELNDVFALTWVEGQGLFAGTRKGLVQLGQDGKSARQVSLESVHGAEPLVTFMLLGDDRRLWIGTLAQGVIIYDPANGQVTPASALPLGADGQLPELPVLSITLRGDEVFVGTWGNGTWFARRTDLPFSILTAGNGDTSLSNNNVTAVAASARSGHPWVGSFGGGIQDADVGSGQATPPFGESEGLLLAGILSFLESPDGRVFAGATDGLWVIGPEAGDERFFRGGEASGLGVGYVTSLADTPEGDLWVGVGGSGLYLLREGSEKFEHLPHDPQDPASLSGDYVTALLALDAGKLLVGTRSNGLNLCLPRPWRCSRIGHAEGLRHYHVTALYRDRQGRTWVATDGGGLQGVTIDPDGGYRFTQAWARDDGLISDGIMGITDDDDGTLWLSSREGLSRLDVSNGLVQNFTTQNGLPLGHFNSNAAARDDRFLYFGAVGGLLSLPVGTTMVPTQASVVRITQLQVSGTGESEGVTNRFVSTGLEMPWGRVLTVEFAVLDYTETPHEYRYRLDPAAPWSSLGARNYITFFGLSPGLHELSVMGRNAFGIWGELPALRIEVTPPFWMTTWFRLVIAGLLLLLVATLHQARMRGLQRRNLELQRVQTQREQALMIAEQSRAELEQAYEGLRNLTARLESAEEDERRRISRELHDELGQTLTAAKITLQRLRRHDGNGAHESLLDDALGMVDGMIKQVREISLSLRPPLLDEVGMVAALKHFLDTVAKRSGIRIQLETDPEVSGNSAEVRATVFRIVQEAINNALRHSGADVIKVSLGCLDQDLRIRIEDNGRGFDPAVVQRRTRKGEHLGILGMAECARAAGGTFNLESEPGHGSRVEATIPRGPQ